MTELREALKPLLHYLAMREAKPLHGLNEIIHGIHGGTEWEAQITLDHLRAIRAALVVPTERPQPVGESARLLEEEIRKAWNEDSRRGPLKTRTGKALRSLRNALDRKALCAVAVLAGIPEKNVRALLDTRRPAWKAAFREGWTTSSDGEAQLTPLGTAIGEALVRQAGHDLRGWEDKVVLTWIDLRRALP